MLLFKKMQNVIRILTIVVLLFLSVIFLFALMLTMLFGHGNIDTPEYHSLAVGDWLIWVVLMILSLVAAGYLIKKMIQSKRL